MTQYIEKQTDYTRILQIIASLGVVIYMSFYAFESPIRYVLSLVGLDPLIFLRDLIIFMIIGIVFIQQLFEKKVAPYFFVFFLIIAFHGCVMILNTGSIIAVIFSAKMLMSMLFGAIAASAIIHPNRKLIIYYFLVWSISVIFIFLNKYFLEFPWADMKTTMFGVEVEVSRDWTLTGAAKRAAGLYRASINAGMLVPLLALVLIFNSKNFIVRTLIIVITLFTLFFTTMKGSLLSFFIVSCLILGSWAIKFVHTSRIWTLLALILMILFPIVLPGYYMPTAEGQFSIASFNMRVDQMWPGAWSWIDSAGTFPFGVGLGGIGGSQRFYAADQINAADNMYVFLYAYFGVLTFLYLGWVFSLFVRIKSPADTSIQRALAILTFLIGYGVVLSIIEDQMCSLFIGAALSAIAQKVKEQKLEEEQAESP